MGEVHDADEQPNEVYDEKDMRFKELETLLHDLHNGLLAKPVDDISDTVEAVVRRLAVAIPYIRGSDDMTVIAEELASSPFFTQDGDQFVKVLAKEDVQKLDADNGYVTVSLLYHLGHIWSPNVYRRLSENDWFGPLRKVVVERACAAAVYRVDRMHHAAVLLLYEICRVQELSINEMELLDAELIYCICEIIERTRDDEREAFNYDLIRLLLVFNDQFMTKNERRLVMINRVLSVVGSRIQHSKTLTENLVFMLNRADDIQTQMLLIKFLKVLFEDSTTWDLIYTNDLKVVLDVILRETRNVEDELKCSYLSILKPLILNTKLGELGYKFAEVGKLLNEIVHDMFGHDSLPVKREARKAFVDIERMLIRDF
ncbi:hypothetical protein SeMB42_g06614 [Synchytrium endobioticum]|uniref:SPIN90/Ldb17 leucine-rich domain-containing protein n=1 Tax=Synchytrium endobioticum TaxID=286115 RepID=A0A507CIB7_9FUNG|nr:hypothetical protein SeMB42_g06614 [Synchytrium endobioticum]TPX39392.1 hypothetical protein SeLEV6574_g07242 [Synchytrium endobioticum]